jgi:hypothetical protein
MKPINMYDDDQGLEYLGHMIEGSYNSLNYELYGSLFHDYRMMIGHMMDPHHKLGVSMQRVQPSMENC